MKWIDEAIFYQVYPQSFKDSNGDGIGDFGGIVSKLDYIRNTGFNAIWINPCFESPFLDAGYDITDYYKTAERYGTINDLRGLFDEVHKRDMHVILDLVPGHTSYLHPWFLKSMSRDKNDCTDRYVWTDYVGRDVENVTGVTGWLRGISDRNGACAVNYKACQPALNFGFGKVTDEYGWQQSPADAGPRANIEEMKKIMSFWLDLGCDGFRVDMAGSLVKNDDEQYETIKIWDEINGYIHEKYPEAVTISEWGEPSRALRGGFDADFLLSFGPSHYMDLFRNDNMLDFKSGTHFFSKRGKGDLTNFKAAYEGFYEQAKKGGMICIPSGNHDIPRMAPQMDEDEIKLAFVFLMTFAGAPFVYYGDEIGMRYIEKLPSVEGGYHRTGARTPMQWDKSKNCGFSDGKSENLYLPVDPDENRPDVASQIEDNTSIYNTVRKLIKLRKQYKCLGNKGDLKFLEVSAESYPLVYERSYGGESMVVIINPCERCVECDLGDIGEIIYQIGGEPRTEAEKIKVMPCSAFIAKYKNKAV